jgi:hypothetical protein
MPAVGGRLDVVGAVLELRVDLQRVGGFRDERAGPRDDGDEG